MDDDNYNRITLSKDQIDLLVEDAITSLRPILTPASRDSSAMRQILDRLQRRLQRDAYDFYFGIHRGHEGIGVTSEDPDYSRPYIPPIYLPTTYDIAKDKNVFIMQSSQTLGELKCLLGRLSTTKLDGDTIQALLEGMVVVLEEINDRLYEYLNRM